LNEEFREWIKIGDLSLMTWIVCNSKAQELKTKLGLLSAPHLHIKNKINRKIIIVLFFTKISIGSCYMHLPLETHVKILKSNFFYFK
jgi:hypothetical protein